MGLPRDAIQSLLMRIDGVCPDPFLIGRHNPWFGLVFNIDVMIP
jgi:hypothetical protein